MITVTASHINAKWQLTAQPFAIVEQGEHGACRVGGDAENGYYAIAPIFGCGRTCSTMERAIQDLLLSNGCTAVRIAQPER